MSTNSTWTALRNPVFRSMWLASLVSGTCVAAQDTAATWTMNRVSDSPLLLSLMSTVASLPFFFFTLPAGALADMVDRKRMMFVMTIWLAIAAGALALVGWFHLINPWVLLTAIFFIGTGFAFYSPAWTSIQPEIVYQRRITLGCDARGVTDEYLRHHRAGNRRDASSLCQPQRCLCDEFGLLSSAPYRDLPVEAPETPFEPSLREFPGIFRFRDSLCPLHHRHSDNIGSQPPVRVFYLDYPGSDTGRRLKGVAPGSLRPRVSVYVYGSRFGAGRCLYPALGDEPDFTRTRLP